jgi:tyrosyl-tRNA synthetase
MFGKAMSIPDSCMWDYFQLVANTSAAEVGEMQRSVESGAQHPRALKEELARRIVVLYWGEEAARQEAEDFRLRFTLREFPEDTAERVTFTCKEAPNLTQLIRKIGAAKSAREVQRLVEQRGLKVIEEPEPGVLKDLGSADAVALCRRELNPGVYKMKIGKMRFVVVTLTA